MESQANRIWNDIMSNADERAIYTFDEEAQDRFLDEAPWRRNEHHFTKVKISAVALVKMVMHAISGGTIEVMGLMQGKPIGNEFVVTDAFGLPVEGTETRVNAGAEANEYMVQYVTSGESVGKNEGICGWYHSHPGYGCWLSGIDVSTQMTNQQFQEPFVAIVVRLKHRSAIQPLSVVCMRNCHFLM